MPSRTSKPRAHYALVAAALAATLALAGCTGTSTPAATSSSGATDSTISIAVSSAPVSLDPAALAEGQQGFVWDSIYDTLLLIGNKGEIKPNAAKSWDYSADGKTLTLKLNKGMTFSNGDPVNAAAVKATLERTAKTPGTQQSHAQAIESIDAPDSTTVVLHLKEPDATLLPSLGYGLGVIADPKTLNDDRTKLNPVGSGPYTLDTAKTVNGSTYVLNRRSDYWNEKAYPFKTITIKVIADQTAAYNALQAGEVDASLVDSSQAPQLKAAGFNITTIKATAVAAIFLADRAGTIVKPLADVRVRQAINMAFAREDYVKSLLKGVGTPTDQIFNPKGAAYDASLQDLYPHDVKKAKELLSKAGYPNGFDVTMPSTILSKNFEPAISQSLGDIGIKVTWDPQPPSNTVGAILSKKYGMFFFFDGFNTPARQMLSEFGPGAFLNPFGTSDPTLDKMVQQANSTVDIAKSNALIKKVNQYTVKNALIAPILYPGATYATKKGYAYLDQGSGATPNIRQYGLSTK